MNRQRDSQPLRSGPQARCALGAVTQAGLLHKRTVGAGFEHGMRHYGRFALVLLLEGHGRYCDERGVDRPVEPGEAILVLPDLGHRYGPEQGGHWVELYLVFEGPVFDRWYAEGLLSAERIIASAEPVETWRQRLTAVVEHDAITASDALIEVCRMQQVLADLWHGRADTESPASAAESAWARQARDVIDRTIPGPVDWAAVARELHVSEPTLRRRFREQFGIPPGRYRTRRMIDRACDLMHRTDLTDAEIADRLGFCDPFYFSRCFKQTIGRSPRAYRRALP